MMFEDSTIDEINEVMEKAWECFEVYKHFPLKERAAFLRKIAEELDVSGDELIHAAGEETNLPEARLRNEKARTIFQLNSYADFCETGIWMDIRIDTALPNKNPARPDIRKMMVPLGPVVVFGASNFPFAYSTAGGDTASAFAAGCPVIVKAHPAHPRTSKITADAIERAARFLQMPQGIFSHVYGSSSETGEALIKHERTAAVGFTGSFGGGRQLFDWGSQRKKPIPVFAEMGSINPVFLFPGKLASDFEAVAKQCAASIVLGAGQFCTNPGLIIGLKSESLNNFIKVISEEIEAAVPAPMLHSGIYKSYVEKRAAAISHKNVEMVAVSKNDAILNEATPTIARTTGSDFLDNPILHLEVFGPYSLVVECEDIMELKEISKKLEGQLTCSIMATDQDVLDNSEVISIIENICGRFILNGVPTGVEVCLAMHHGGPYPATTDPRFSSVGGDAIKRFARPLSFQNWSPKLLPMELKDGNPLDLWRTVDGVPGRH